MLIVVLIREFRVSGIRMIAAAAPGGGKVIAAGLMGKAKTVFQMISIILAFAGLALRDLGLISQVALGSVNIIVNAMMWIMAVLTVVSGMQYILPNLDLIKNAK